MAASLDRAVYLYAVNCVWTEMDGVSVANIGLSGFADLTATKASARLAWETGKRAPRLVITSSPAIRSIVGTS